MEPDLVINNIPYKSDLNWAINFFLFILVLFFTICLYYYFKNNK